MLNAQVHLVAGNAADDPPFAGGGPTAARGRAARWAEPELVCRGLVVGVDPRGDVGPAAFKGMRSDKDPRTVVREQ